MAQHVLLIGANQKMILCSQLVGNEQMVPNKHRTKMASKTVWSAVLSNALAKSCQLAEP